MIREHKIPREYASGNTPDASRQQTDTYMTDSAPYYTGYDDPLPPKALPRSSHKKKAGKFRRLLPVLLLLFAIAAAAIGWQIYLRFSIPDDLQDFARKYPEASQFVRDYPLKHNADPVIDVSSEVIPGEIPLFIQWDERWGYRTYGSGCMGMTGCGPTCLSMVYCGLTGDPQWDPWSMARYAESQGYYVPGEGSSWELMTEGAWQLGLYADYGTVSADYIWQNLSPATPIIASMSPGDFTYGGHFIVLTGFDEDGNILVNDPNSPANSSHSWTMETLLPQIASLWLFSA